MKSNKAILITCFLSCSSHYFYAKNSTLVATPVTIPDNDESITLKEITAACDPLIISQNIDLIVKLLTRNPSTKIFPLYISLLHNKILDANQKKTITVGLVSHTRYSEQEKDAFIKALKKEDLHSLRAESDPLLYIASATHYHSAIPHLHNWQKKSVNNKKKLEKIEFKALYTALLKGNLNALQILDSYGIIITHKRATQLLFDLAKDTPMDTSDRDRIAEYLINRGANINARDAKRTILMHAVERNDIPMTRILIKHHVAINDIINLETGSALQISAEKNRIEIQEILIDAGAVS